MTKQFDILDEFILGNLYANRSGIFTEHALHPKNVGSMENASAYAAESGHDGNTMEIWLLIKEDVIEDASFWTDGCGTTIACGSMLTEIIKRKAVNQALFISALDLDQALG